METVIVALLAIIAPTVFYILYTLVHNHFSNQFFQKNFPKLPIMEGQKPLIGHLHLFMGPRNWRNQQDSHKKLGKTYGAYLGSQRAISTIDLDFIKKFAVDEDKHARMFKFSISLEELEIDCWPCTEGEQYRRLRKAMAPAFSKHKVMSENVQNEIDSVIDKFIASIEWRLDKARREKGVSFIVEDVDDYLHKYMLALIFSCFYKKVDLIDFYAEADYWHDMVTQGTRLFRNRLTLLPMAFPLLNPIMKVMLKIYHPIGKYKPRLLSFIREQAELYMRARLESKKNDGELDEAKFTMKDGTVFRGNMIDYCVGKYVDRSITAREFYHSSFFLFLAADKTASDALSRLIYLLACNQDVQDKLRESVLVDGIESTYMTWVMNESLRLFPPVHMGCSRNLSRPVETKFGTLPVDTFIQTPVWTIHRWPEYWGADADEFKPERWAKSDTFHPLQFIPFGAGQKNCPGREFALREMRMLMVKLLQRYKFERSDKTVDSLEFQAPFHIIVVFDDPTWVKISRLGCVEKRDARKVQ